MDTMQTKHWSWLLVVGILLIIVGLIAIASPIFATITSLYVLGGALVFGGIMQVIFAFTMRQASGFSIHLLLGLLAALVGILIIVHPASAALSITMLLAIFFLVLGAFRVLGALLMRFDKWGWFLFSGIIDLILGILILAHWPTSAFWIIGLFVGIDFLFVGWTFIATAYLLKQKSLPIQM